MKKIITMKRIALLCICQALSSMTALSAVAPYGLKDLESSSTHILSGKVSAITSRTQKSKVETAFGVHRDRVYTVKLAVTKVSKGTGVKLGEVVDVLLWQPSTRMPPLPGPQGHTYIPKKGDAVMVYGRQQPGIAFKPIMPNGIVLKGSRAHQEFLHGAAEAGDIDLLKRLIAEGLDVNANFGMGTPLKYAAWGGHKEAVQFLLAQGAKVDGAEDGGRTPLRYAAWGSWKHNQASLEVAKQLIKNGADVNSRDDDGFTPLHEAAMRGSKEITELLIENGAEANTRISSGSYKGKTPLDLAQEGRHTDVIAILRKHAGKSGDR